MFSLTDPAVLSAITKINTLALFLLSGAALGMYLFAIPIIRYTGFSQAQHANASLCMLSQFHLLIQLGQRYMQTSSRTQFAALLVNALLLYIHRDPSVSRRGVYTFVAAVILVQTAWYEVVFIFPTNDRLVAMKAELLKLGGSEREERDKEIRPEVLSLLRSWRAWHIGRIVLPVLAGVVMIYGAI